MKRRTLAKSSLVLFVLSALILITGCQTPGKVVSTETSPACPKCEIQTVTTPIKGLTYTKCVCPMCKAVETDESKTSAALANYISMDAETVPVCEHCKSVVIPCPACAQK